MANSIITFTGDGVTTQRALNFTLGILKRAFVKCRIGTEVDGLGDPVYRDLEWITDGLVNVQGDPAGDGVPIVFTRTMPKDELIHNYSDGVPIIESNLDESNLQTIMSIHEFLDGRLGDGGFVQDINMNDHKIINLADGVDDTDAANMRQLNETITDAQGYVEIAEQWATKTSGLVAATDNSSKAYAIGGTGVSNTSGKGASKEWAVKTGSTVDTSEYSAKEYAQGDLTVTGGSAKAWATDPSSPNGTSDKSAKSYSILTAADAVATAADRLQTGVDATVTSLARDQAVAAANGMKYRSVRMASTANVTLSGLQTIDAIVGIADDRVLLKNQSAPAENGLWLQKVGAWVRASDGDTWNELVSVLVTAEEGSTQADVPFLCTANQGGTLGTTAVTFVAFQPPLLDGSVTNNKLASMPANTVKMNNTGSLAAPLDITKTDFKTWLALAISDTSGLQTALDTKLAISNARIKLTAPLTIYVGYNLGNSSISIASPGVVQRNGHGLSANDAVQFSILPNTKAVTISVASPGVVTWAGHGLSAGQPVKFTSSGRLPVGLTQNTTYYVKTVLDANTFTLSATSGGSAINTTAPSFTVTLASPGVFTLASHGLTIGDPVAFATTGALPTGLVANTMYFVKTTPTGSTFTVSATPEGAAINTSVSQSGTHTLVQIGSHFGKMTGTMPTGLTVATTYYVKTVLNANTFTVSATPGGTAINTSGSTEGLISIRTGNDNNDGLAQTQSNALLSKQRAIDLIRNNYDLQGKLTIIQVADGADAELTRLYPVTGYATQGSHDELCIRGNLTTPENCLIRPASGDCFNGVKCYIPWRIEGFRLEAPGGSGINIDGQSMVYYADLVFGACSVAHVLSAFDSFEELCGAITIDGGAAFHRAQTHSSKALSTTSSVMITSQPTFTTAFLYCSDSGYFYGAAAQPTYTGPAKGKRYEGTYASHIFVSGAGSTYIPGDTAGTVDSTSTYI